MKRVAKLAVVLYVGMCVEGIAHGNPFLRIPEADRAILSRVSAEYGLTPEQRRLLFAVRLAENGGPGREMGVLTPAAMRYKCDHAQSLECQARWAAGTIQKRYHGDLNAFAQRWCPVESHPLNRHWLKNVEKILSR